MPSWQRLNVGLLLTAFVLASFDVHWLTGSSEKPGFVRTQARRLIYKTAMHFAGPNVFTFMNYGIPGEPTCNPFPDEPMQVAMYVDLLKGSILKGKRVLEVGSGRGGGASALMCCFGPESYVGVDIDSVQVDAASAFHVRQREYVLGNTSCASRSSPEFVQGSAMDLPFEDGSFDVVVNVESSHDYAQFDVFVKEVRRVLKPGGRFFFADFRQTFTPVEKMLEASGFIINTKDDITDDVLVALQGDEKRKVALIDKVLPWYAGFLRPSIKTWASVGSKSMMWSNFVTRKTVYKRYSMTSLV